ncbi:MAG: glycoside hydrolase family 2 TIM barrel-domain containing protein [Reichenbachiella sp.]|uniref:glycoside hydrolase family 2 TIM barrel-domain containing protein n=1 Tax=Reichenbachiella sp. TaxID=2184521 RepID=UPI0029670939|nr:glycoside hydrolase family 2 TIM barrel-domain containing protein [Reichenbachiella sp.]MDW3211989.1 glycoside hydrolase family 2 TIM barrel-domain containing protein [Reichenbachiella sp.]
MKKTILSLAIIIYSQMLFAQVTDVISLNGKVSFEQTKSAFPPSKFTRTIPVPGLIDLAEPKIDQYEAYFSGTHEPRYSWYKFTFKVPKSKQNKTAILTALKSRFNTQVILNGIDLGSYMQNNTPIDVDLTDHLVYGKTNTLLLRLGERAWMPKKAATGFDREKYTDIPGIWDDIKITFGGPIRVHRALALPDIAGQQATVKVLLENYAKVLERNTEYSAIEYTLKAHIREKKSGQVVTETKTINDKIQCQIEQQEKVLVFDFKQDIKPWSPADPFLYEAVVEVSADRKFYDDFGNPENLKPADDQSWIGPSDQQAITFGMRDFKSVEKSFQLNGEEIALFGSTLTLNRFFEDRDRGNLPWNREWVEKMMIEIPEAMGWNFFRVSIGLLPEFWYDLADEHGILIQNEYNMWNLRGRPEQYAIEYTDWIWADGNHPSVVIWDALNEQKQEYIGRELIPELRMIDPTRLWDLGFMKAVPGSRLDVFEYHWYPLAHGWWVGDDFIKQTREAFRFGKLNDKVAGLEQMKLANAPVIVNEFAWLWQNRDGLTSGVRTFGNFTANDRTPYKKDYEYYEPDGSQLYESNRDVYEYYVGKEATADQRWAFQAYLQAIETEMIRSTREADGVASFAYLTNNNGHTGDWFINDIKDLIPSQALLSQYHATRPFAAFLDIEDARYVKSPTEQKPGSVFNFNIQVVNDTTVAKTGSVRYELMDVQGAVVAEGIQQVAVQPFWQTLLPVTLTLPEKAGGYLILTTLDDPNSNRMKQVSLRYIQVGDIDKPEYFNYEYQKPEGWPK